MGLEPHRMRERGTVGTVDHGPAEPQVLVGDDLGAREDGRDRCARGEQTLHGSVARPRSERSGDPRPAPRHRERAARRVGARRGRRVRARGTLRRRSAARRSHRGRRSRPRPGRSRTRASRGPVDRRRPTIHHPPRSSTWRGGRSSTRRWSRPHRCRGSRSTRRRSRTPPRALRRGPRTGCVAAASARARLRRARASRRAPGS